MTAFVFFVLSSENSWSGAGRHRRTLRCTTFGPIDTYGSARPPAADKVSPGHSIHPSHGIEYAAIPRFGAQTDVSCQLKIFLVIRRPCALAGGEVLPTRGCIPNFARASITEVDLAAIDLYNLRPGPSFLSIFAFDLDIFSVGTPPNHLLAG